MKRHADSRGASGFALTKRPQDAQPHNAVCEKRVWDAIPTSSGAAEGGSHQGGPDALLAGSVYLSGTERNHAW